MDLVTRFQRLQLALMEARALWGPAPFHEPRPAWCAQYPALAADALALDEARLEAFIADPAAAGLWLEAYLPELAGLLALTDLPELPACELADAPRGFDWSIPGAKRQQIEAFARHAPMHGAPLLEWCAGKGHLGRRMAMAGHVRVDSLELDPQLCEAGAALAQRHGVTQQMHAADALAPGARSLVAGREVVALHACGELHRRLVRHAREDGARAYAIAPCCYYRGADDGYWAMSSEADLALSAAELRMAVTETVTAPAGVRRRLARDQAWKLGFKALCAGLGVPARATFRPVPAGWMNERFEDFSRALALREALVLPPDVDWAHWERIGEQRRGEVRRLEVVRHAFRRPLEVWLVLDMAVALQEQGFDAQVGRFCERALTPRNLMVLGRA
ncbi:MAG: methyltransferase [Rhodocyclaceae bacterium]|nr:methyltransferase [Rhodocyclaceae bacterium]